MIKFTATSISLDAAAGEETQPRTISGIAVPYGPEAVVMSGHRVRIEAGAIPEDGPAPRLLMQHQEDARAVVGMVTERVSTDEGMMFTAKIANTTAGNDLIELLKMGALDSVSVGLDVISERQEGKTRVITAANWRELSVVFEPAFADAKILEIAASTPDADEPQPDNIPEEEPMSEQTPAVEASAETIPTAPIVFAQAKALRLPSAGEYIAAMRAGGSEFAQLNANIHAATGDVLVSDSSVPTPIVEPLFTSLNPLRPIVTALGAKAMPQQGASFLRPYVKVASSVGLQSTELTALSTADFEVGQLTVSKKTFGGKLILSEQAIDWSSPSMLDAAIEDLAGRYALATEKDVVDTLAAGITNSQEVIVTDYTDSEEVIADLYTASAAIATAGNYLPNALVVSPAMWAKLGSLVDLQGRPLFPMNAPANGAGLLPGGVTAWNGNPLGLTLVVSNQVGSQAVGNKTATEYSWLMNTRGVEVYEQYKGFLRDESVGTLGVTIAVRGYFAAKIIDVNMIRILGPDATFA
jgi:HK97 family phage prohead protease/HK97 family phage major capsid protein